MTKLFTTVALVILWVFCVGVTYARNYDEIKESGVIVVALYEEFPPYSYIDEGRPAGIDVEIAQAVAKDMGVGLDIYWLQADESLDDDLRNAIWKGHLVSRKKADVMLRVPYDAEYNRRIDPATGENKNELTVIMAPYHYESWMLMAKKERLPELPNGAPLIRETIGVEVDSLPYTYFYSFARGRFRNNAVTYIDLLQAIPDFMSDKITVVVDTKSRIEYFARQIERSNKGFRGDLVFYSGKYFLQNQKYGWNIGIAVHADNRFLGYSIKRKIDDWTDNGFMKELFLRYGVTFKAPFFDTEGGNL